MLVCFNLISLIDKTKIIILANLNVKIYFYAYLKFCTFSG